MSDTLAEADVAPMNSAQSYLTAAEDAAAKFLEQIRRLRMLSHHLQIAGASDAVAEARGRAWSFQRSLKDALQLACGELDQSLASLDQIVHEGTARSWREIKEQHAVDPLEGLPRA